jgi:hypothetical protein
MCSILNIFTKNGDRKETGLDIASGWHSAFDSDDIINKYKLENNVCFKQKTIDIVM